MLVNLSKILSIPSYKEEWNLPLELTAVDFMGNQYPISNQPDVKILAENIGKNQLHFQIKTKIHLTMTCDRCLDEVPWECEVEIEKDYDKSDYDDEWNQEGFIQKNELDLERLIVSELLPKIPMKVLCKDDCKGICPVCGANQNKVKCGCDQSVPDPRMSAIQDIFNNFKEV